MTGRHAKETEDGQSADGAEAAGLATACSLEDRLAKLDELSVVSVGAEGLEQDAPSGQEPATDPEPAPTDLSVIDAQQAAFQGLEVHKRRRGLKAFLITLCVLVVLVAAAYVGGAMAFQDRFMPNTRFGTADVSLATADEVKAKIDSSVGSYQLDVVGGAFSYRASAEDLGLNVDSADMVREMLDSQDRWRWPLLLVQGRQQVDCQYALSYDKESLGAALQERIDSYNEGAEDPKNAHVDYDDVADAFIVTPEVPGTRYVAEKVIAAADDAVMSLTPLVSLGADQLVKPEITSGDERLTAAAAEATKMVSAHLKLKLADTDAGEIGPDDLHDLVTINDDLEVSLDEDELSVWIDGVVKRYNTVGTERTYTRPDGKEITVRGGDYGWEIDQDSLRASVLEAVRSGEDSEIDVPCWSTAEAYNGKGEPDWNKRYADVDLTEQHVRFYNGDGDLIWESDCISGMPDGEHDTVEGVWSINNKESPSKLIGRDKNGRKEYETTVSYWMAFEENSIGFHDATWQPGFGGQMYRQGFGSHGCVNLPYDKAQELYDLIDWDDVVIVHW